MSTKPTKKPKDPNAPKKNQSSYFHFSNERRPVLQLENKGRAVTEISKTISAEWKVMDPARKKMYEDRAATDKIRYQQEYEVYAKTEPSTRYQKKLALWKEKETALGHIGKGSKGGKGGIKKGKRAPKKPKQPDDMPKRPQSSYFVFSNERRVDMKDEYPDKKLTELSGLIAAEWKKKTDGEKKVYEDRAKVLKERYMEKIAEYKKTDEYSKYMERVAGWKVDKKRWDNDMAMDVDSDTEEMKKVKLPRKPKDDKCPKRALTSYFLYAKEVREATKVEFPNLPITQIAKEISKKWNVLTEEEKKPYNEEAARLKEKYKLTLSEYQGSEAQQRFKIKLEEWKQECDRRRQAAKKRIQQKKEAKSPKKKSPRRSAKKQRRSRKKMQESSDESSSDSSSDSDSDSGSDSSSSSSDSSSDGSSSSSSSDSD
jgi:hypothetical protein